MTKRVVILGGGTGGALAANRSRRATSHEDPGLHLPTMLGGVPGVSTAIAHYMNNKMEELDIPSIPEFVDIITLGELCTKAAGGQIIFT